MRVTPKTDEELQTAMLCHPGTYSFQVMDAKSKVSKSGNDMIELNIKYWDSDGRERLVFDYLLDSMAFKLKHFCKSVGLLEDYEAGVIDHMKLIGKSGHVEIIIQPERARDDGGMWPAKNSVKDYVVSDKPVEVKKPVADLGDDIPF